MGWLIALGVVIAVGFFPLGIHFEYDEGGLKASLIAGFLRIRLLPARKKPSKEKKQEKKDPAARKEPQTAPPKQEKEAKSGGSWRDFLPLVQVALDFLGDFVTRLCIRRLELKVILAGSDKYALAMNYGKAWAALGNLLPTLDRVMNIKKRDLEIECDFAGKQTTVIGIADITITLGRGLWLLLRHGCRGLKVLLKMNQKKKDGTKQ